MSRIRSGSLGTLSSATSGTGVYVGDLADVVVTLAYSYAGTFFDASAAATIEISQDGTRWASTVATSAVTYDTSKSYQLTGRVQFVRITATVLDYGSIAARYSGRVADSNPARFGTLGDIASQAAGTAVDVSDLERIIVTSSGGTGNTTVVQTSYNGTDWHNVGTLATTTNSILVPIRAKLLRVNCTTYNAAEYLRYGGHKALGKQRFGTLGDFTGTTTGTAVDVSDLDAIDVYAFCSAGCSLTYVIEGSSDGVSWAIIPDGTKTATASWNLTTPYRLLRAQCTVFGSGTVTVRFGGVNNDLVG